MVLLTSFKKSRQLNKNWGIFSVARFQPKGFSYPSLDFLAAADASGNKLLLRNFEAPLVGYPEALRGGYKARWKEIEIWLQNLSSNELVALACWCPYSQQTQEQVKRYGSFCCHTGLIGKLIRKHRPDIQVMLDDDRQKNLVPEWRP